jgi:hypothetical protein
MMEAKNDKDRPVDHQQRQHLPSEFARASRRSEQEAILAINAVNPVAAAAHASLAVMHAARASGALRSYRPGPSPLGEAGAQLRGAYPPIGPAMR